MHGDPICNLNTSGLCPKTDKDKKKKCGKRSDKEGIRVAGGKNV